VRDIGRVYILPHVSLLTYVFSLLEKSKTYYIIAYAYRNKRACACTLVFGAESLFLSGNIILSACGNNAFLMSIIFSP